MSISQGIILNNGRVLMVKQRTKSGKTVWNFPGGNIEKNENSKEACVREVKEETGYEVVVVKLLHEKKNKKWTYFCKIIGGKECLDTSIPENEDLLDIKWVDITDEHYFDDVTTPIINIIKSKE